MLGPRTPRRRQWKNTANVQYILGRISNIHSDKGIKSQLPPAPDSRIDESPYEKIVGLVDLISPTMSSAAQNGNDPVENKAASIRHCGTCKKRIYGPDEMVSSTHMSCSGEEAKCTCIRERSSKLEKSKFDQKEPNTMNIQGLRRGIEDFNVPESASGP